MKFISKKLGNEKFNFLDLLKIEGKIKKIYIASAYCETDVIYKMLNCQAKCDTSYLKTCQGVFQFRHFLGRLLISSSFCLSSCCVTFAKSVFLG